MIARGRHFQFTLNNPTHEELESLRAWVPRNLCKYIAWGHEVAPQTNTPHLQGCLGFGEPKTLGAVRQLFIGDGCGRVSDDGSLVCPAHIEPTTNALRNYRYAVKVGRTGGLVEEFGDVPSTGQGTRNDLELFLRDIRAGMRLDDVRERHYAIYARNTGAALEYILQHMRRPNPVFHPLRDWQGTLYQDLQGPVCDRKVFFVVDPTGNGGKSWFCKYVDHMRNDVLVMRPTRRHDMAFIFLKRLVNQQLKCVFIDCSRTFAEKLNYDFLEELKDGHVTSGKYASSNLYFEPVHVVVMMNQDPDMNALSADRYDVRRI